MAFQANRFGDRIAAMHRGYDKVCKVLPESIRRLSGWYRSLYYFSPDQLAGKQIDIRTLRRLADCPIPYGDAGEFGNPEGTQGTLYPGYDAEKNFGHILTEYDADFLMREIEEVVWQDLTALTRSWGNLWMEVISERYWANGRIADDLVFETITWDWRDAGNKMREDVHGWCSDALQEFSTGASRVLRHTIETAQRCVLANMAPIFAAVRTEEDLIRSWKSYLGQYLKGRIVEEGGKRAKQIQGERPSHSKAKVKSPDSFFDESDHDS